MIRKIYAAELVFDPRTHLRHQIKHASSLMGDNQIQKPMQQLMLSSRLMGYATAAKHTNQKMPKGYGGKILADSIKRSKNVAKIMDQTTKNLQQQNDGYTLDPIRANRAASYEAKLAYYAGVHDALEGMGLRKSWIVQSSNPCEECQDAEDESPIMFDEPFSHGELSPALHLNCECLLSVHR